MRILCLGAAGKISQESVNDLVEFSDFEKITIADCNEQAGREVVQWLDDKRVDFEKTDFLRDREGTIELMRQYDIVMDGTPISLNDRSTGCIAEAGQLSLDFRKGHALGLQPLDGHESGRRGRHPGVLRGAGR